MDRWSAHVECTSQFVLRFAICMSKSDLVNFLPRHLRPTMILTSKFLALLETVLATEVGDLAATFPE